MAGLSIHSLEVALPGVHTDADGLRILHLSDLHFRRWNRVLDRLSRVLLHESFDLVLITGDFCHRPQQWQNAVALTRRLLAPITPTLGAFAVLGNHDPEEFADEPLPFVVLRNSVAKLKVGAATLRIAGVEQSAVQRSCLADAVGGLDYELPQIVLAHYPSTVYEMPIGEAILMLAGHTHGGQIRVPGLGCVYAHDDIPLSMARGLHAVRGNWLNVSAGIGASWLIPARICCPPEISFITLRCGARAARGSTCDSQTVIHA